MTTVSFPEMDDFDLLSQEEAENVIYEELLPICEKKGIYLSAYGNRAGRGSLKGVDCYKKEKKKRILFDVPRIQLAFAGIPYLLVEQSTYKRGSYGLKHSVEFMQKKYLANGDLIAALLLRGYAAKFGKHGEELAVNCEFKVDMRIKIIGNRLL